jgi:dihydroorotate dehydrogenase (NAD+) catalytic subunit
VAGPKRTLAVDLGAGLVLATPVMIAAGCSGTGRELAGMVDLRKVGALVSRSITVLPRKGSPSPRVAESASGIVWDTGWQNPGIDAFLAEELPRLARGGARVIVSTGGSTLEEVVRLTSALLGRPDVAAIELNLSVPDEELSRAVLGAHADRVSEIVGAAARLSVVPVFAKLPGGVGGVADLARAAVRAGAHGVTLMGSPPAMVVDAERLRAQLGGITGWLSGPALRPLTLRAVFEVTQTLGDVPVIAVGGIRSGRDAIEMLLAGAWAVQVGAATLADPAAPVEIAQGIAHYLKEKNLASPADARARLRVPATSPAPAGEPAR